MTAQLGRQLMNRDGGRLPGSQVPHGRLPPSDTEVRLSPCLLWARPCCDEGTGPILQQTEQHRKRSWAVTSSVVTLSCYYSYSVVCCYYKAIRRLKRNKQYREGVLTRASS